MKCTTPECREDLKRCISKKLDVKTLALWASIIVLVCSGISALVYNSYAERQNTQSVNIAANTNSVRNIETDIGKMQTNIEWIMKAQEDSRRIQEEILKRLDALKDQIRDGDKSGDKK